jgi:Stage II sporulation protein M
MMRALESERPEDERVLCDPYARLFVPGWLYWTGRFFTAIGYAEWSGPGVQGFLLERYWEWSAFLGAWILSYLLLPEGLLRGRSAAQALAKNNLAGGSVWLEWLRILAIDIGILFLSIIAPNLLRTERDYPLGYISTTLIAVICGVTLGTDSFTASIGGKMPPTIAILGSSGLYEITAYVLAAAATVSISRYRLVGKWGTAITPPKSKSVIRERLIRVLLAIAILVFACGWEAYRFSQATASWK